MKTKFISIAATLLLAASFNTASATYYLVGPDHNWTPANGIKFTGNTLTRTYSGEFKIVDVQGDNAIWYGAEAVGHYELNCINNTANLTDRDGAPNLYLKNSLEYTFTFDSNSKVLTVTGFSNDGFFITGDFNNWKPEEMTKNSDGSYTITKENVSGGNEFKFRDADGTWYGGNSNDNTYNIKNAWRSYMSIASPGKNFKFEGTPGTCTFVITEGNKLTVFGYGENLVSLSDNGGNNFSTSSNGVDVVINGRTLKANQWNTLCLPFNVYDGNNEDGISFSGTLLQGASVKTLSNSSFNSENGTLGLTFNDANTIEAGKPYIVKVNSDIVNPRFTNVTISAANPGSVGSAPATFIGTYNPEPISGQNYLYLGAENTLYYPSSSVTINPFRAYFKLNLPSGQQAKSFVLNFGDDNEETSIKEINNTESATDTYFTLDGRRLNDKPATAGLYIINGKKVVIK